MPLTVHDIKIGDRVLFKGAGSCYHHRGIVQDKTKKATVVKTNLGTYHVPHHEIKMEIIS